MHCSPTSAAALLPLGALLLAGSLNVCAQTVQDTPAGEETKTLKPVTISGTRDRNSQTYQSGVVSVGKTQAAAKDIPQSLTVVTEKLIHDEGKDTLKGALQNVPGITFEAGEGGRIGDNIRLRGFTVAGDIYLDGMRDIAQYNRDTFNLQNIEVLRGSASMLFGRGSTGGVVNQVSKQAHKGTASEINTTVGTGNYLRLDGDFNVATSEDSALRFDLMSTDWDGRADKAGTHRRGLAADYGIGLGTTDEWHFSVYHLDYNDKPDLGGRWLQGAPAPLPTDKWYGVDSDYQRDSADIATASYTHYFDDGSSLKTKVRDGQYRRDLWATQLNAFANTVTQDNLNGNTTVNRGNQTRAGEEHHTFLQSDYLTRGEWFNLKQELLLGAEYALERSTRYTYSNVPAKPATTVAAASNAAVADTRIKNWANTFKATTLGLYVQDTVSLTDFWKVVAGLRWDQFGGDYDRLTGGTLSRTDSVWSKRLGLMYQPTETVSYYASYGTSFNTSGDLYQYDANTANTPPESSRNIEVGIKWELADGDLSVRTALARTDKYNERNTDINQSTGEYLLSGQRHTDSLEFEVQGKLTERWEIFAGLVFMNGVIDQAGSSAASQATVGLNPGLTPAKQANLWTTYRLDDKWRVGGGITAVSENHPASSSAASLANTAPGYVKADALVEYQINPRNALKLNIDNVGDTVYYSSLYQGWPSLAPGRSVRLTWTANL
ncbi:TonB-dependent siderophore receptor [Rhodoferax sp. GW822-FHT02A01]|uniref:TonB-dependent receptor n=1 Tax=Rhodoferax sp. GW822-FHT02A01 TaxID=3141537 RepID=UPI00315C6C65